jgi:type I restriction enzyme S subunit
VPRFTFSDIAFNSKAKKRPTQEDCEHYVGLEHLDTGSLVVRRWGAESPPVGDKLVMRKGDVLFGKRRAYQRKVAIAPFDGIFSAHGMVLRPNERVVDPRFFPFFLRSDRFMGEAVRISVGGLSPTINWSDLSALEFDLPDLSNQRAFADRFWAVYEAEEAYRHLLSSIDDLVKSQFVEMFGDPVENPKEWTVEKLGALVSFETSGSRGWAKYYSDDGELFITIKNVRGGVISLGDIQHIHPPRDAEAERTRVREGDLLISITADLGRTGIVTKEIADIGAYVNQHLICLRLNQDRLHPLFASHYLESPAGKEQFSAKNRSAVKAGLNFDAIRDIEIYTPPRHLQDRFAEFVAAADKSKFAVRKSLEKLDAVYKALSKEAFG